MPTGIYPIEKRKGLFTKEHKTNLGKKHSEIWKEHQRKSKLGSHHSEETRLKMREVKLGNPVRYWLGKKISKEHNAKLQKGKLTKCPNGSNWRGGITPIHEKIRKSYEYKLWRKSVFERDNYTCIWCGQKGGELNANHIKPFALFPELRFAIDNGRTLCIECHKKVGWRGSHIFGKMKK